MILDIIFYYIVYLFLQNLYMIYKQITLLNKLKVALENFLMSMTIIKAYNNYIDYNYNQYLLKRNTCAIITLNNNKKYNVIISNLHKISGDFALLMKYSCFSPLFTDIQSIVDEPNLEFKKKLHSIFKHTLPREIIQHIGNYICNCKLCKDVINSS
tara:strand:- start:1197 stop:1664 length:468 start_codon:yes stop_codon:yes gene_type:complete